MGKARTAVKYSAAGAVTALYAAVVVRKFKGTPDEPVDPIRVAVVAGVLTAVTWVAALA